MKKIVFFFFLITIVSCKNGTSNAVIEKSEVNKEVEKKDPIKLVSKRKTREPIKEFQKFVENIEKENWFSDTLRIRKVYKYLSKEKLILFNNRPFFNIDFENSEIKRISKIRPYDGKFTDSLEIQKLENVKSIWSYFYRGKKIANSIEDGVIEQWEFKTEEEAKNALFEIRGFGQFAYFNTRPYYFQFENYVFIFHTRAMAYSYGQKVIYEKFKKNLEPK